MRLGLYPCKLDENSKAHEAYESALIYERHRHRYEFNNTYRQMLEDAGLVISGRNPKRDLVEIIEVPNHPYFVACQFHPEFNSRPNRAHPLFQGLIDAAHKKKYN